MWKRQSLISIESAATSAAESRVATVCSGSSVVAQARWRAVNAPHLVALVRAGALVHKGKLLERLIDSTPTEPDQSTQTEVA